MRYRIKDSPWPEREGLECVIVEHPPGPEVYPFSAKDLRAGWVVVWIEDDPLRYRTTHDGWTCVLRRRNLVEVDA